MIKHEAELIIVSMIEGETLFGNVLYDYREDGGNLILNGTTRNNVEWSQEINPRSIAYMKLRNPKNKLGE